MPLFYIDQRHSAYTVLDYNLALYHLCYSHGFQSLAVTKAEAILAQHSRPISNTYTTSFSTQSSHNNNLIQVLYKIYI